MHESTAATDWRAHLILIDASRRPHPRVRHCGTEVRHDGTQDSGPDGGAGGGSRGDSGSNQSSSKNNDVVIDDIDDKPIDLSEIPF